MEEIEYLEEYEDLILPTINSNTRAVQSTRSVPNMATAHDDEDSSSIDQDIFESLFDGQSDDDNILQKNPKLCSQRDDRVSLDSLDMLVKDLVGERLSPPPTKSAQKVANIKKVSSTLSPARIVAKGHSTPNVMRPTTSSAASKQKMSNKSDSLLRLPTNKSKSIATVRPKKPNQQTSFSSTNFGLSRSSTSSSTTSVAGASGSSVSKATASASALKANTKTTSNSPQVKASSSFASKVSSSFATKPSSSLAAKLSNPFAEKASSSFATKTASTSSVAKAQRKLSEHSSGAKHSPNASSNAVAFTSRKQISAATSTTNDTDTFNVQRKNNRPQPTIIKPEKSQTKDPAEDPLSLEGICDDIDSDSDSLTLSDISGDSFASLSDLGDIPPNIIDISNDSSYEKTNLEKIRGETPSPTVSDIEFLANDGNGTGSEKVNDLAGKEGVLDKVTIISDTLLTRLDEAIKDTSSSEEQQESKEEVVDKKDANIQKETDEKDYVEHQYKTSLSTSQQTREKAKTIGITITASTATKKKVDESIENENDGVRTEFIETIDKGNADEKANKSESAAENTTAEVKGEESAKRQIVNCEKSKSQMKEKTTAEQGKLEEKSKNVEKSNEKYKDIEKYKEKYDSNKITSQTKEKTTAEQGNLEEKSKNVEKSNEKSKDFEKSKEKYDSNKITSQTKEKTTPDQGKLEEKSKNVEKSNEKSKDFEKSKEKYDSNKITSQTKEKTTPDQGKLEEKSKNVEKSNDKYKDIEKSKEKYDSNNITSQTKEKTTPNQGKLEEKSKNVEKSNEKSRDIEKSKDKYVSNKTTSQTKEKTTPNQGKLEEKSKNVEKSNEKSKDSEKSKEKYASNKTTSQTKEKTTPDKRKLEEKSKNVEKSNEKFKDIEKSKEKYDSNKKTNQTKEKTTVEQGKLEAKSKNAEKSNEKFKDIEKSGEKYDSNKTTSQTKEKTSAEQGKLEEKSKNEKSKVIEKSKEKYDISKKTRDQEMSRNTKKYSEQSNGSEKSKVSKSENIETSKVRGKPIEKLKNNIESTKHGEISNDNSKDNNKTKEKSKDMDNTEEKSKNIETTSKVKSKILQATKGEAKSHEKSEEKGETSEKYKDIEMPKNVDENMQGNSRDTEKLSKSKSKGVVLKTLQRSKSDETMKVQEKTKDVESSRKKSKSQLKSNNSEAIKVQGKSNENSKNTDKTREKSKDIEKAKEKSKDLEKIEEKSSINSEEIKMQEKATNAENYKEKSNSNVEEKAQEKPKPISKDFANASEEFKGFEETKEKEMSTASSKHMEKSKCTVSNVTAGESMDKFAQNKNYVERNIQDKIKGRAMTSTTTALSRSHKATTKTTQQNDDKSGGATKESDGNKKIIQQKQTNKETKSKDDSIVEMKESQNKILSLKDKIYKDAANKIAKDIQTMKTDTTIGIMVLNEDKNTATAAKPKSKEQNTLSTSKVNKESKQEESIKVLNESKNKTKTNDNTKIAKDKHLKPTPSKVSSSKDKEQTIILQSTDKKRSDANKTINESKVVENSTDGTAAVLENEISVKDKYIKNMDDKVNARNLRNRKELEGKKNTTPKQEAKTVSNNAKLHHEKSHQQSTNKTPQQTVAVISTMDTESSDHEKTTEDKDGIARRSLRKRGAETPTTLTTSTSTTTTTPSTTNDATPAKKVFKEPSINYETPKEGGGGGGGGHDTCEENKIMSPRRNLRSPAMQNHDSSFLQKKPKLDLGRKLFRTRHNDSSSERENSESDTSTASKRSKPEAIDQSVKRECARKVPNKIEAKEAHVENKNEPHKIKEPMQSEPKCTEPQSGKKSELKNNGLSQNESKSEIKTKEQESENNVKLRTKELPKIEKKSEPKSNESIESEKNSEAKTKETFQSEKKVELKVKEPSQGENKSEEEQKIEGSTKQTENDKTAESEDKNSLNVKSTAVEHKTEIEEEKTHKEEQDSKVKSIEIKSMNVVKKANSTGQETSKSKQNEKVIKAPTTDEAVEKEQNEKLKIESYEPPRKLQCLEVVQQVQNTTRRQKTPTKQNKFNIPICESPSKSAVIGEKKLDDKLQQQTNQRRSLRTREADASTDKGSVRKSLRSRVHVDEKEKLNATLVNAENKKHHEKPTTKSAVDKKEPANILNTTNATVAVATPTTATKSIVAAPTTKATPVETSPTRKSAKSSPTKSPGYQVMTLNEWLSRQKLAAEENKCLGESPAIQHDNGETMPPVTPTTSEKSMTLLKHETDDTLLGNSGGGTNNPEKSSLMETKSPHSEDGTAAKNILRTSESKKKKLKDEIEILRQSMPKEMRDSGFEFATKNCRLRTSPKILNVGAAITTSARVATGGATAAAVATKGITSAAIMPLKLSVATADSRKAAAKANVIAKTSPEIFKMPPIPDKPSVVDLSAVDAILKDDHQKIAGNRKLLQKSQIKTASVATLGKISITHNSSAKMRKLLVRINRRDVTSYFKKLKSKQTNPSENNQQFALSTARNKDLTITTNKVTYTAGKILSKTLKAKLKHSPSSLQSSALNKSLPPPLSPKIIFSAPAPSINMRSTTAAKAGPANVLTIPPQNRRPPQTLTPFAQLLLNDTTSETEDEYETQLYSEDMESYLLTPMRSFAVNAPSLPLRKQPQFEKPKQAKINLGAAGGGTQKHPGRFGTSTATATGTYVLPSPPPAACASAAASSTNTTPRPDIPAIGAAFSLPQSSSLSSNVVSELVSFSSSTLEPKAEIDEDAEDLLTSSRMSAANTPAAAGIGITAAASASSTANLSQQLGNSAAVATASMFGLTPPNVDSNGTRLYSFLHPAKYNRSHSHVLLDYCCPNLDGPMPAIDPTRIHSQVQSPVRELPAYIVMTTKLITRADLEGNNNTIPASIRQKVEKITSHSTNATSPSVSISVAAAASTSTGTLQLQPPPPPLSLLATPPYLSALQKQLPASTIITPKQNPAVASITISKPGGGEITHAVQSGVTQNQLNENQRLAMRSYLRRIDASLKKLSPRFTTLSVAERQNMIEHIYNTSAHTLTDYSSTARVLDEFMIKTSTSSMAASVSQTMSSTATSSLPASIAAQQLDKGHVKAVNKFQLSPSSTSSSTRTGPAASTATAHQKSLQYVPIFDIDKNIIGYQIATSAAAPSAPSAFSSHSPPSSLSFNTKSIAPAAANASATNGSPTTGKLSSLKQPLQDSPRIFYTNSTMQPSTPVGSTKTASATSVAAGSSASLRSATRLGRDITVRQLNTTSLTTTTTVTASPAPVVSASDSVPVRLPTLIRNPNLTPATHAAASTTSTTKSAITMTAPPTLKRMTRKTAAAAAAQVIVITQDSNATSDECILPDGDSVPQIKSEKDDEDFIGAS